MTAIPVSVRISAHWVWVIFCLSLGLVSFGLGQFLADEQSAYEKRKEILELRQTFSEFRDQNLTAIAEQRLISNIDGLDRVIDLLAKEEGVQRHLLLVGDGPARESLEQHAEKLGISDRVTITGVVERNQVADYVAAFDVALQPDVVEYASPLKLFEYLALGRAIVAPDTANIREVLVHEANALLFDADNLAAFPEAVERFCHDDTLRQRLGEKARETISERGFTWDNNAQRVVELFRRLEV